MLTLNRKAQKGGLAPKAQACDLKLQPKTPTQPELPAGVPGLAAQDCGLVFSLGQLLH